MAPKGCTFCPACPQMCPGTVSLTPTQSFRSQCPDVAPQAPRGQLDRSSGWPRGAGVSAPVSTEDWGVHTPLYPGLRQGQRAQGVQPKPRSPPRTARKLSPGPDSRWALGQDQGQVHSLWKEGRPGSWSPRAGVGCGGPSTFQELVSGGGAVPAPGCTGQQVGPGLPEPLLGSVRLILGAVGTFSKSSVNLGQPTPMIRGCSGPSRGLAWPSGSGKEAADAAGSRTF